MTVHCPTLTKRLLCITVSCILRNSVACPKTRKKRRTNSPSRYLRLQLAKRNFLIFRLVFFSPPLRKASLAGEKVNSLEKLAGVGRIVDRGSCFGRVFCTDATIATVRPARNRRSHMSSKLWRRMGLTHTHHA